MRVFHVWRSSAASNGNTAAIEFLMHADPSLAQLHSDEKEFEAVSHFPGENYDWNFYDRPQGTALREAVLYPGSQRVLMLLKHGFDPEELDDTGDTVLSLAARFGDLEAIRVLLSYDCIIDIRSRNLKTALMSAASYGQLGAIDYLLERGANMHTVDRYGDGAITAAAIGGHFSVFTRLIKAGSVPSFEEICDVYLKGFRLF